MAAESDSTENLIKRFNRLKLTINVLTIVVILLLAYTTYTSIVYQFTYLIIVPIALAPLVFKGYSEIRELRDEIRSREGR